MLASKAENTKGKNRTLNSVKALSSTAKYTLSAKGIYKSGFLPLFKGGAVDH